VLFGSGGVRKSQRLTHCGHVIPPPCWCITHVFGIACAILDEASSIHSRVKDHCVRR
jgi:hypothetical protein